MGPVALSSMARLEIQVILTTKRPGTERVARQELARESARLNPHIWGHERDCDGINCKCAEVNDE